MHADGIQNALHGSDSPISAQREIKFFFPHRYVEQLADDTKPKIPKALEDTLCKGLTELAKQKPSQDPTAAIIWLGDWLLQHNPKKPLIYGAEELAIDDVDDGAAFAPYLPQEVEDPAQASWVSCSLLLCSIRHSAIITHRSACNLAPTDLCLHAWSTVWKGFCCLPFDHFTYGHGFHIVDALCDDLSCCVLLFYGR